MKLLPPSTPPFARIINGLCSCDSGRDHEEYAHARGSIPGWSLPAHFTFFGHVLAALPPSARILVCGVYHGLDLALISHAARLLGKQIDLTGVDLFSSAPCADWPEEKRHLTWEQAFDCPPPSLEAARRHAPSARLVQARAHEYMRECAGFIAYDFIYLDTSHDEATVRAEIAAALPLLAPGGLLAGDDYYQPGSCWGVDHAVTSALPGAAVFFNRIWLAAPPTSAFPA